MSERVATKHIETRPIWKEYLELCKPRVVMLMLITAMVGMCLATPTGIPWSALFWGNLGIMCVAGGAAAINHVADQHADGVMKRTEKRPLVQGTISTFHCLVFASLLCVVGMLILIVQVNLLTALLTLCSLVGYAGIYTFYLKHATSQNIVIGGLAGASPPLLGWVAVTGHISAAPLLLVLIIFIWTPPHFWALAIYRIDDYKKAKTPMLPITHGIAYTKLHILLYTLLLFVVTLLPFAIGMSSWLYLGGVLILNARFLYWAIKLKRSDDPAIARATFRYSITYLLYLFCVLLADHYLPLVSALFY